MKKTFIIETDGSFDENDELKRIIVVDDLCSLIWDLSESAEVPEEVQHFVRQECYERGINIHELWR